MPAPIVPLSGNLKDVSISAVLHALKTSKKTGVLTARQSSFTKTIHFQGGEIVFASSNYSNDGLGEILLRTGAVDFKQYETVKTLLKTGSMTEGAILIEQGVIKPKIFFDLLLLQIKEIVLSVFLWEDALYGFRESSHPLEESIGISIDPDEIIYHAWIRVSDYVRLTHFLPPLDSVLKRESLQSVPSLSPLSDFDEIVRLVNSERTIREVLTLSGTKALSAMQTLNTAIATEKIIAEMPLPKIEEKKAPVDIKNERQETGRDVRDAWKDEPIETKIRKILEIYERISSQNYYQILDLTPSTEQKEVKRAYFKLAKRYHPDHYLSRQLSRDVQDKIDFVFSQLTHAYDVLSHEDTRQEYDKILSNPAPKYASEKDALRELVSLAEDALSKNDLKNGLYFLEELIRKMPESLEKSAVYLRYGQTLSKVPGRLKDAVSVLQKSAALDSSQGAPHFELGLVYVKAGLTEKAESAFREAIKRDPDNKAARDELAKLNPKKRK